MKKCLIDKNCSKKRIFDDFTYKQELWTDGVRPKGLAVFADILSKSFRELGLKQMSVSALLA